MSQPAVHHIWNPDTGIVGLSDGRKTFGWREFIRSRTVPGASHRRWRRSRSSRTGFSRSVVTHDDKKRYLDALEAADKGDLEPCIAIIVRLQIAQFRKASAISEEVLATDDDEVALDRAGY